MSNLVTNQITFFAILFFIMYLLHIKKQVFNTEGKYDGIQYNQDITAMEMQNNEITTIGGTFDALHTGHLNYIKCAYRYAKHVRLYLSSDRFANQKKCYTVIPYSTRLQRLRTFLGKIEVLARTEIVSLDFFRDLEHDFLHNTAIRERISLTIIGPEYYDFFIDLNNRRMDLGLESFAILVKMRSRNKENIEFSSERIRNGEIRGLEQCYHGVIMNGKNADMPLHSAS